jgi:hypothetical protein
LLAEKITKIKRQPSPASLYNRKAKENENAAHQGQAKTIDIGDNCMKDLT